MAGLITGDYRSVSATFVIEDGLNTRELNMRVLTRGDASIADVCHKMGREILREAVRSTSMLACIGTHPNDSESE